VHGVSFHQEAVPQLVIPAKSRDLSWASTNRGMRAGIQKPDEISTLIDNIDPFWIPDLISPLGKIRPE
jgi:hypothetical protein